MSAQRLTDKQITCRSYGHSWQPTTVNVTTNTRGEVTEYHSFLECSRCKATRKQVLDNRGEVIRSGYSYAKGYLRKADEEGFDKPSVRLEFLARMVTK